MIPIYPQHREDLMVSEVDDELIVLNEDARVVLVLNATAKHVWDLCDSQHTAEEIEQHFCTHFSIPPDRDVRADVIETISTFFNHGLLNPPG